MRNGAVKDGGRRRRSKPCSVCRRWFTPTARVGDRQRTCGEPSCRREQKRRTQAGWTARHPDYWAERRVRAQADRLATERGPLRGPPPGLREIPFELAQDAMGVQAFVIIVLLARIQHRATQDAIKRYLSGITRDRDPIQPSFAQDATEVPSRPP